MLVDELDDEDAEEPVDAASSLPHPVNADANIAVASKVDNNFFFITFTLPFHTYVFALQSTYTP